MSMSLRQADVIAEPAMLLNVGDHDRQDFLAIHAPVVAREHSGLMYKETLRAIGENESVKGSGEHRSPLTDFERIGRAALWSVMTLYECVVFGRFLDLHPEKTQDFLNTFH